MASRRDITVQIVSPRRDQAMDILVAAGVLNEKTISLVAACERGGRDPVAFSHHFVSLASVATK